jgi:hypothetical protein
MQDAWAVMDVTSKTYYAKEYKLDGDKLFFEDQNHDLRPTIPSRDETQLLRNKG